MLQHSFIMKDTRQDKPSWLNILRWLLDLGYAAHRIIGFTMGVDDVGFFSPTGPEVRTPIDRSSQF